MLGRWGGRLQPGQGDGVEGWLGATGVWRQRWCVGRYRDSRVDGRPVPHVFLCGPLPFSFVEKEKTASLGECGLLYETGRRVQNGPNTSSGRFRSRCNSVAALVLQLLPGAAVLFSGMASALFLGRAALRNYSAREGRDGDITLRRPRFGALSTPCGALFRMGEVPVGARR